MHHTTRATTWQQGDLSLSLSRANFGGMQANYRLKPMVAARLFAEITVLTLLVFLPLGLWLHGDFSKISPITQGLIIAMTVVSLVVLPAYGFITFQVSCDNEGLRAISLFRKQMARWHEIEEIKLKTSWGVRRYVVKCGEGEVTFPVWLHNIQQLTEAIRSRLPNGGLPAFASARTFVLDLPSLLIQFAKTIGAMLFVGLFWLFFAQTGSGGKKLDPTDSMFILGACILFTLFLAARAVFVIMMPRRVQTDPEGISLSNIFFNRQLKWNEVKAVAQPLFFLPEGLLLKTARGPVFIGDQIEAFDELHEELGRKLAPDAVAQS